jgi:hypothetical protein
MSVLNYARRPPMTKSESISNNPFIAGDIVNLKLTKETIKRFAPIMHKLSFEVADIDGDLITDLLNDDVICHCYQNIHYKYFIKANKENDND